VVGVVLVTVDHTDIRGSKPHNRDPSGAASDYKRGFGPKTYRIELDKTQQFASYRRDHDSLVLALGQQLSIALIQPLLCVPRNLFDLFADLLLPLPQLRPHRRSVPVSPRSFHNHPP
jgi:hypothetical protein